eukprot:3323946-Amphidinium_carterae.1
MEEELQQSAMVTCQTDIEIDHLIALETELMAAIQQEDDSAHPSFWRALPPHNPYPFWDSKESSQFGNVAR